MQYKNEMDFPLIAQIKKQILQSFIIVAFFSFFINILVLTIPLYMIQIFDRVVPTRHLETLLYLTIIAVFAILVSMALEAIRTRSLIRIGAWGAHQLKPAILEACMKAQSRGIDVGKRPLEEGESLRSILASPAITALFDLPWVPVFIAIIWFIHPALGVMAMASSTLLIAITVMGYYVTRQSIHDIRSANIISDRFTQAIIQNAPSVMAMGMWPDILRNWKAIHDGSARNHTKSDDLTATISAITKGIRMLIQIGVLGLGVLFAVKGDISAGSIIAVSILLGRALAPVDVIVASWKQLVHAKAIWQHLNGLLQHTEDRAWSTTLPAPKGAIFAQGVTFVSPDTRRVLLHQVGFALNPGETLAIIGNSGAGKSTLCKAILGYLPLAAGKIQIDGASINDWRPDNLGPYLGYLSQRSEFFPGSIKSNIARFQDGADAPVIEAAQLTNIHEMILNMPKGYDTMLTAQGAPLSGGQQQRLGLARAIYKKPKILVLDEPSSNLDDDGFSAMTKTLKAAREWNATIIIVMHNQKMIGSFDKILRLHHGRVQAFGKPQDIFQKPVAS
ncbi:MAG: type I secretion system permease/ATPase [Alphaproteobacteria bacterium]